MSANFIIFNELTALLEFIHTLYFCSIIRTLGDCSVKVYRSINDMHGENSQPCSNSLLASMPTICLMPSGTYYAKYYMPMYIIGIRYNLPKHINMFTNKNLFTYTYKTCRPMQYTCII